MYRSSTESVTRILPLYSRKITPEVEQGFALLYVWKYVNRKTIRVQEQVRNFVEISVLTNQGEEMQDMQPLAKNRSEEDYYSYNWILPLFFLYRSDQVNKCILLPVLYYRFHAQVPKNCETAVNFSL